MRFVALCLVVLLASCSSGSKSHKTILTAPGMAKTRPDPIVVRHIVLREPHSGETVNADYFHNGHYDQQVLGAINHLMRDRHANVVGAIDPELIDYMIDIRTRLGLPPSVVFDMLSGYRTRDTNARLSFTNSNVAKESLHMHGWAVDFRIDHVNGMAICEIAKTMQRGGVAYYPKDNHVHVDLGNIRTWQQR
jgi:hypothetical protein